MKLSTVRELSEYLRIEESTIYHWASDGTLPSYKIGFLVRFDLNEIEEWIKNYKKETPEHQKFVHGKARGHRDIDTIVKNAIGSAKGKGSKP